MRGNKLKNKKTIKSKSTAKAHEQGETVRGDKMFTKEDTRQTIDDLKYYIKCKQDDINDCLNNIEDINEEVKELRIKIKDLIFNARNNGLAIVKLTADKEGLEEDLHDIECGYDVDLYIKDQKIYGEV